jgi:hypothetical protein
MTKLDGIMKVGEGFWCDHAETLLLQSEADETADRINAIGRGEIPYDEAEFDALIARLAFLIRAMRETPVATGRAN